MAGNKLHCSVVVPVYNGAEVIERCLDALADQTLSPHQYEIVVVDDGSTDRTRERIKRWHQLHPNIDLRLMYQSNAGPASARNRGAFNICSPLILFTDADCRPTQTWIETLTRVFDDEKVMGAKGTYLTTQKGLVPRFVQAEYEDKYDRMQKLTQIDFIDTYSAAYRHSVFCQNDGFDTTFTTASVEDQEFSFRLAKQGHRLVFVPTAQVVHIHDANIAEYWHRKYTIGYWKALLARQYPERMVNDSHTPQILKVQMLLWAMIVFTMPFVVLGIFWSTPNWLGGVVLALIMCFGLTTICFMQKLANRSWVLAMAGFFILIVRSLALGFGFLRGLIHFARTKSQPTRETV